MESDDNMKWFLQIELTNGQIVERYSQGRDPDTAIDRIQPSLDKEYGKFGYYIVKCARVDEFGDPSYV